MLHHLFHVRQLIKNIIALFLVMYLSVSAAIEVPIYDFSLKPYPQNIDDHIPSDSSDYSVSLLKAEYQTACG